MVLRRVDFGYRLHAPRSQLRPKRSPADELLDERIGGIGYELVGRAELRDAAPFHDEHAIAELERFADIVGHEKDRQAQSALQV